MAAYTGPFSGGNKLVKEGITAVGKYECIPQITVSQTEVSRNIAQGTSDACGL